MVGKGWLLRSATFAATALLTACGGGGGVNSTPTPPIASVPTPTPTPVPTPTPTPATTITAAPGYDTPEYRATVGAVSMDALAAYNAGATGRGVGLAIIDTGIDLQSAEFDNRISSASAAVGGEPSVDDESGHGTAVAFTAAGRRNGSYTHGVAFEATVIALRADRAGSCAASTGDDSSCKFSTDAIAAGVDAARTAGARVINMSLGGSAMPANLRAAIGRATAAGIVVVIAAGNDGTDNPDSFTAVAGTSDAHASVIIAGSVGAGGTISSFSDKAGSSAAYYLTAVGESVRAPDASNTPYLWSGTSFATPQISGAVALLAQAFPNLTGAQIVDLLLTTARDAGAPGVDAVYGRGILDLTRAFQPVGSTSIAGQPGTPVTTTGVNGQASAPMGDASAFGVGAVILDGYNRAFAIDLARTIARHAPSRTLTASLQTGNRQMSLASGGTAVAMTLAPVRGGGVALDPTRLTGGDAQGARAIAATVTQRLGSHARFGFAARGGAEGLVAQMTGRADPAFLVADANGLGFDSTPRAAGAVGRRFGPWGLTAAAESGDALSPADRALPSAARWQRSPYTLASLTLDRRAGPLAATLAATRLMESATVLGARLGPALGSPNANSWFLSAAARLDAGAGWSVGGSFRRGWSDADVHGFAGGGRLTTTAYAADIGKAGVFGRDSFGLRVSQPLRVASGGIDLTLPTAWDYASQSVSTWTTQRLGLAPTGRELDMEARYARPFAGGALQANLFWRRDPGNWATLPADRGAALRWSLGL